jgi:hypothetical protein
VTSSVKGEASQATPAPRSKVSVAQEGMQPVMEFVAQPDLSDADLIDEFHRLIDKGYPFSFPYDSPTRTVTVLAPTGSVVDEQLTQLRADLSGVAVPGSIKILQPGMSTDAAGVPTSDS